MLRMMQTGTNFNTKELEDILKSFKKNHAQAAGERENRNAQVSISHTAKNAHTVATTDGHKVGSRSEQSLGVSSAKQHRYAPTEVDAMSNPSFQVHPSMPMFPDIDMPKRHKQGNKFLTDDRKILGI